VRRPLDGEGDCLRSAAKRRTDDLPRIDDRRGRAGGRGRGDRWHPPPARGGVRGSGFVVLDDGEVDAFRREVYAATRAIAAGSTATYGEIARAIGRTNPEAAREVGAALARNPTPIIVPCHRVVGANGKLTGFSAPGGLATKRRMLELEGAPGYGQQILFG
jgi:O-6-methylguanine DNA methyltransferase